MQAASEAPGDILEAAVLRTTESRWLPHGRRASMRWHPQAPSFGFPEDPGEERDPARVTPTVPCPLSDATDPQLKGGGFRQDLGSACVSPVVCRCSGCRVLCAPCRDASQASSQLDASSSGLLQLQGWPKLMWVPQCQTGAPNPSGCSKYWWGAPKLDSSSQPQVGAPSHVGVSIPGIRPPSTGASASRVPQS